MVQADKIYTRAGDEGMTCLVTGQPVSKTDARLVAAGAVDELNAQIAVARLHSGQNDRIDAMLGRVQNDLIDLSVDLATPLKSESAPDVTPQAVRMSAVQVERLEKEIDWMSDSLKPLDGCVLPGGSSLSTHLHVARAICRRAEREAVAIGQGAEKVNAQALRYLNRLSDHLFVAGRRANANGADDVKWVPGLNSNT